MLSPSASPPSSTPTPSTPVQSSLPPALRPPPSRPKRVLGNAASQTPDHRRSLSPAVNGRASPSPSTTSVNSDFLLQDDSIAGAVGMGSSSGNPELLVCPICSEEMMTLLQLNRHLDDVHREVEETEKDDITTWFRKRMLKAKQFQPVAVLNQKLKGLDVFEPNDTSLPPPGSSSGVTHTQSMSAEQRDADFYVTRNHWQKSTLNDFCLEPACRKPLGALNGSVNCRKCGKLFCEEHTMYQIKLSRSAQYEPVRGYWCRVCETCFKSREGYNDHQGVVQDHTEEFKRIRRKTVDRAYLEVSRLEKRLTKLTQLLTNPPKRESSGGFIRSVSASLRDQRRELEQSVVQWEDDTSVLRCPYCEQTFSRFVQSKHHCRLCGKVVCGDLRTGCSTEVGLNVAAVADDTDGSSEKRVGEIALSVRICSACKAIVFSKRDFATDITRRPADLRAYSALVSFEQGIRLMMPRFQKLLTIISDPHNTPTAEQLAEASKTRKKLLDTFAQYDATAKRILNLPSSSPTQLRLQKAIHQSATQFLQANMLPLKSLPKVLSGMNGRTGVPSKKAPSSLGTSSPLVSESSGSAVSDEEEKRLKEHAMVLEEQKFMMQGMLEEATKRRRFDEVATLSDGVKELEEEISKVRREMEALGLA